MKSPHVFIAILSYTGQVWISTMQALLNDIANLQSNGINVSFHALIGCTYIHTARSEVAATFLKTDATHLMFVDWDIVWATGDIAKLVRHGEDVVAGDYPRRREPIRYNVKFLHRDGKANDQIDSRGLLEVEGVPTGFMLIKREVIEKMTNAYPELRFSEERGSEIMTATMLFGHRFTDDTLQSDDYSFCDRWRNLGGKVFIDTTIKLGHIGFKMFVGDYQKWLKLALAAPADAGPTFGVVKDVA